MCQICLSIDKLTVEEAFKNYMEMEPSLPVEHRSEVLFLISNKLEDEIKTEKLFDPKELLEECLQYIEYKENSPNEDEFPVIVHSSFPWNEYIGCI